MMNPYPKYLNSPNRSPQGSLSFTTSKAVNSALRLWIMYGYLLTHVCAYVKHISPFHKIFMCYETGSVKHHKNKLTNKCDTS